MTVLVTGAAGFIGWKTCEFLLKDGHTVIGIDNLNDYYDVRLKKGRLKQLLNHSNPPLYHRHQRCFRAAEEEQ